MDGGGTPIPIPPTRMYRGRISGPLLIENFVSFPTAVVRRECLARHGVFDESLGMGIDYDLWLRLSVHCDFDFVEDATIRYRIWSGQMSKNYRKRYESAIRIIARFVQSNPEVVAPAEVRRAWAHTYVGRGEAILWNEKNRWAAMHDFGRALRYLPGYWPAWRAALRSFITMRAPRAES
jgi:tetratricopeptide (TPR) repeat protein